MVSSQLPDEVNTPIIFKFSTDMIPILLLSVQAEESQPALYKILDDNVVNPLARVPGVGTVSIAGAPKREVNIYCDPNKLEAYDLTIETISSIVGAENKNTPGGTFDVGSNTYSLRVEGEFKDPKEMENIVVGTRNGASVYLRDVATVVDSVEERAQETYNNGVQGAMIVVQKQSGANSVNISQKVMDQLPKLQKSLPSDVKLGVIVNTSDNILNTIDSLTETIMYAILFVVLVVFVFLGRWRATVIICITIPMSLIASFIYLAITDGGSLNIISLSCLSIAIGNVVDDAIVVLENVTTHIERGSEPKQAAIHGTNEVAISVIASTLTMIAVFFPLTMVSGMSGVLFRQLGWMMCVIMTISTISALSFTPMMCAQMLRLQKKQSKCFVTFYKPIERALDGLDNWYQKRLNWAVRHRRTIIAGCFGFFLLSLICAKGIGTEFFPSQDNSRISVQLQLPIGARVERAQALAQELTEKWLKKYEGVMRICNYTVGQADADNTWASIQDNGSHIISFNINLYNPDQRSVTLAEVCDGMREDLKAYPELDKAQVILGGSSGGMGGQATADFEIYGYDFTETDKAAAELKEALLKVNGVSEVNISRQDYQPEYQVAAQFESLTYPFIIMFSIPFAFSGVLMALYGTGTTLNVMSLLGGIMLIGIVVKNGIVLIDYITLCRERGMSVIHSVVVSGRSRLRPVLMTTLTTILGMVPMAIGGGEGSEMWQPLGVSVIGGLTVSTVLTLILVPVLYCSFAGTGIKRNRKKMKAARELNDYYQAHKTEMTKGKKE